MALTVDITRKAIAGRPILEGLRFDIGAGEIVALVGPSGCGKTTALRIIAGLDRDYDGTITWADGHPGPIGTVFQEPRLLPWQTIAENIALVAPPDPARIPPLLARLGLAAATHLYPGALSGGMARRAALCRALAVAPDLLLLDEPFVSLDPATAESCRDALLDAWHDRPCSMLIVTHDRAEAACLADRVIVLSGPGPDYAQAIVTIPPEQRRRGIAAAAAELLD